MSTPPIGAVLTAESAKLLEPGDLLHGIWNHSTWTFLRLTISPGRAVVTRPFEDGVLEAREELDAFTFLSRPSQAQEPSVPAGEGEIKACPFCGRADSSDNPMQESAISVRQFNSPAGGRACRVECCCGAQGKAHREHGQAVAAWNTRSLPAPEASGAGGWRGIETAPRDGTRIVGWGFLNDRNDNGPLRSSAPVAHIMQWRPWRDTDAGDWVSTCISSSISQHPTHWMPLPAAPVQADSTEEVRT